VIRDASVNDAKGIAEVQVAAWHAAYRGLMPDERLDAFTLDVREDRWLWILSDSDPSERARTTVYEREGRVVGFASVGPCRDEGRGGEIWALYVHPAEWRTGVGRALLDEGLAHLERSGFARARLWVLDGNARAIRFYEAAGFRLDGGAKNEDGLPHLRMQR
jgi:ribosomal protein S18 acetylase RimI-like enzyme